MIEIIPPITKLQGSVKLPGSKSITNRALLLASLANGKSEIHGALKSDDTKFMAAGLRKLGIKIEESDDETTFVVHGKNGKLEESAEPLFLGNAGTATRFLTAAAILVNGTTTIDGDPRMRERPIGDLVKALRQLGAKIKYLKKEGCLPLQIISNGQITNTKIRICSDISSQFLSAILMIAPLAKRKIEIIIESKKRGPFGRLQSEGYISLTEIIQSEFGVILEALPSWQAIEKTGFIISPQKYESKDFIVESDASSATYFWAAEKLLKQKIKLFNVPDCWSQPDAEAKKIIDNNFEGNVSIRGNEIPDAIPTLVVLAAFSGKQVDFSEIANLRVKECDRIHALAKNLNKIKAGLAEEWGDSLMIHGDRDLAKNGQATEIETYNDHRIAMSFALAGLKIKGIKIRNPDCVSKSFPNFWEEWRKLGVEVNP